MIGFCLRNYEALKLQDDQLVHLLQEWKSGFKTLIADFSSPFQDVPGCMSLAVHDVDVSGANPPKQHLYRLAPIRSKPSIQSCRF